MAEGMLFSTIDDLVGAPGETALMTAYQINVMTRMRCALGSVYLYLCLETTYIHVQMIIQSMRPEDTSSRIR